MFLHSQCSGMVIICDCRMSSSSAAVAEKSSSRGHLHLHRDGHLHGHRRLPSCPGGGSSWVAVVRPISAASCTGRRSRAAGTGRSAAACAPDPWTFAWARADGRRVSSRTIGTCRRHLGSSRRGTVGHRMDLRDHRHLRTKADRRRRRVVALDVVDDGLRHRTSCCRMGGSRERDSPVAAS